jgi:hypothetical protein
MVVVAINPGESETLCMAFALVLTDFVFLEGKDIRIVIENGRTNIMLYQPLYNGRGARGATSMKQYLASQILWYYNRRPFHFSIFNLQFSIIKVHGLSRCGL